MKSFLSRFADQVTGVLSGFDRVVFRGYLRRLCYSRGLEGFLAFRHILRKDFGAFAEQTTEEVKEASLRHARESGRPIEYLKSSSTEKEDEVRRLLREHPIEKGLICVLSAVEPCTIWNVHRSREQKRIVLEPRHGKCLHLYHYFLDPVLGPIHVRLQTWLPFTLQVYVNGREWLARRMRKERLDFTQADNCFTRLADPDRAQQLFNGFVAEPWQHRLDRLAALVHPALTGFLGGFKANYFWTVHQSEWATDVMFRDPEVLASLMPVWVRHAIADLHCSDVFRFLGKKLTGNYQGEVLTKVRRREEGICVRFVVGNNSLKFYDKFGDLRVEATVNNPKAFRVNRRAEGGNADTKRLRPLRKGLADMRLRANVCQAANKRVLEDLAIVDDSTPVKNLVQTVTQPTELGGRRVRALQPWSPPDVALLEAVARGEFFLQGFRNRDIAALLYPDPPADETTRRRRCASVSRRLRMLRAHGMIERVPHTYRYLVTSKGRAITAAILGARDLPLSALRSAG